MQRRILLKLALMVAVVGVLVVGVLSISLVAARAKPEARVPINGQTVPLIKQAHLISAASGQQQLNLSIGLQLQNKQALDNLLSGLYNPQSSLYHHFLTPQQFAAEFGPSQAQQQQVVDYLQSQGLTVTQVAPNGLLINASGTVAQVNAAFGTRINNYQLGARRFYGNESVPTAPDTVAPLILSVGGLDNSVQMRPLAHFKLQASPRATGSYGPTDLTGAYNAAPLDQGGVQGSSQTIGVFELDGYQSSDINQYLTANNLPRPSITNVLVDGADGSANQGAIEVELDIEVVAGMAPKAAQIVYEGPNSTQGVNDTYNRIVTDNKAQVVTTSWGECEAQSGTAELQTLDGIFKQAAAQGMTLFAAAGDSGAYDCNDTSLAVDSPAGDPYITGVGGTNLQASGGVYNSESVWSDSADTQRSPEGSGGGGGISSFFARPGWQTGPGVQNSYSNGNREVPDVSADADPQTGYAIYCTVSAAGCPSSGNIVVGGTSAAAPLWAGSSALINEYLQQQGKDRMGFASPLLYGLANSQQQYPPFHDVTSGNNLYYPATANYDQASGLGTPNVYNIARDLAGGAVPVPTPTPGPPATPTPTPAPLPSPTSTAAPVPTATSIPTPPTTGALIQNGDFEHGTAPWREASAGGYELIDSRHPHSGIYGAYLCGYTSCNDVLAQDFTVPSSTAKITVSYWWNVATNHTAQTCRDSMTVQLLDSNGKTIDRLQRVCNTAASQAWRQATFDATSVLARYAGQKVTLIFSARTTNTQVTTAFYADDVAVMAS